MSDQMVMELSEQNWRQWCLNGLDEKWVYYSLTQPSSNCVFFLQMNNHNTQRKFHHLFCGSFSNFVIFSVCLFEEWKQMISKQTSLPECMHPNVELLQTAQKDLRQVGTGLMFMNMFQLNNAVNSVDICPASNCTAGTCLYEHVLSVGPAATFLVKSALIKADRVIEIPAKKWIR